MFTEQTRRHALAAALPPSHRDARALVEASVRNVLDAHPELRAVRWTQRLDDPDPTVLLASKVVVEFEHGATFSLDTATADGPCDLDPAAYAVVADLLLAQTDMLVDAFGVGVTVRISRDGAEVAPLSS